MIIFLVLFSALISFAATNFDLAAGLQGRTLPALGAEIYAESGYNQILWGKKKAPADFLYGLIRPSLGVSTSGVINSIKGEFEFYPISFLGISLGRQIINSNYDFPFFDCKKVTCQGEFVRNFVESKIVLGAKGWVAVGNYRVDTLRGPSRDTAMADWRHVIVGEAGEEVQIEKKVLFGKIFSNKLLGILAENVQFLGSRERKESYAAVYQVRHDNTSYMLGAGAFRTSQQSLGVIFYFRIHYQALPTLKLF